MPNDLSLTITLSHRRTAYKPRPSTQKLLAVSQYNIVCLLPVHPLYWPRVAVSVRCPAGEPWRGQVSFPLLPRKVARLVCPSDRKYSEQARFAITKPGKILVFLSTGMTFSSPHLCSVLSGASAIGRVLTTPLPSGEPYLISVRLQL